MIPQQLRYFFWDTNCDSFDPHSHPQYTIFRLLEYGDSDAIKWMRQNFSEEEIVAVLRSEKRLSPRSANFWALVYGIPHDEVTALISH